MADRSPLRHNRWSSLPADTMERCRRPLWSDQPIFLERNWSDMVGSHKTTCMYVCMCMYVCVDIHVCIYVCTIIIHSSLRESKLARIQCIATHVSMMFLKAFRVRYWSASGSETIPRSIKFCDRGFNCVVSCEYVYCLH